jgi:hypothetical protein
MAVMKRFRVVPKTQTISSTIQGNASISRFFVNGEYVGTAERALFRSRLNMAGYRAQVITVSDEYQHAELFDPI